jgi:hypothetical protein
MKRRLSVLLGGALVALAPTGLSAPQPVPNLAPMISEAGPHSRRVEQVWTDTDAEGRTFWLTNSYVEVCTGLHVWRADQTGQGGWVPAVAQFEETADGHVIARQTQHQIILPPDLTKEPVDMLCPDGVTRLVSAPYGVSFFDLSTGGAVLVGQLRASKPEVLSPTVVVYPDCMEGLSADLVYEIGLASIEQTLVFRVQPPRPEVFELNSPSVRVQMLTEFFDPPAPAAAMRVLKVEADPWKRQNWLAPDLVDVRLTFGDAMTLVQGRAFVIGEEAVSAPVGKSFGKLGDELRHFLIESADWSDLAPMFSRLPEKGQAKATVKYRMGKAGKDLRGLKLPPAPQRLDTIKEARKQLEQPGKPVRTAQATSARARQPGVALDYLSLSANQVNWTFTNTVTTYVTGPVVLSGTNTCFEEGAVIKFSPTGSAKLTINSPITWNGSAYRPVVLTARDDTSVGEAIGSATLTNYYAVIALDLDTVSSNTVVTLQNFRIAHAQTGLAINGNSGHLFSHGAFVNCQNGISPTSTDFSLRNVLFHNVLTNFNGSGSVGRCEHVTANTATYFNYNSTCSPMYLTNSLLAGVTTVGVVTSVGSVTNAASSGVFQTVGNGAAYPAAGSSYRDNAGASTNLNAALAADLKLMTTYPPIQLSGDFLVDTTLSPQAQRDTGCDDLGYHYWPLDYVWSGLNLTNATLTLTNGVAVGIYGAKGTTLKNGARFISEGTPIHLNRLVHYNTVQEQPTAWGAAPVSLIDSSGSPSPLPIVQLRFTDFAFLADSSGRRYVCSTSGGVLSSLAVTDCLLRGAYVYQYASYSNSMTISLNNNFVQRGNLSWYQENSPGYYPFTLNLYNNLFYRGSVALDYRMDNRGWMVKDNAFDNITLTGGTKTFANSNNGYINTTPQLGGGSANVTLSSFTYANGPLGNYYQYTTNFYNAGSRSAAAASLYHYTVTNGFPSVKELTNTVSIGYHYIAVDTNNLPNDCDGDGIWPDYLEDRDGDGTVDSGETDWQSATDLGLRVWITRPRRGPLP